MRATGAKVVLRATIFLAAGAALSACTTAQDSASLQPKAAPKTSKVAAGPAKQVYTYTTKDRECLKRAMYFESQRSSETGFLAVGSVIMNRLTSGMYPETICGVVAQKNQFAPGVMTRRMDEDTAPDLNKAADEVLKGKRHPQVKEAMFFHRDGLKFPYDNMHYTTVAGGNAFYEKRDEDGELQTAEPKPVTEYTLAFAGSTIPQSGVTTIMTEAAPAGAPASNVAPATTAVLTAQAEAPTIIGQQSGQLAYAAAQQPVAPVITAEIARASVAQAFDAAYAVPQNSSATQARAYSAGLTTSVPVPEDRPDIVPTPAQKRPGAGLAMAEQGNRKDGISYDNWAMRTSSW